MLKSTAEYIKFLKHCSTLLQKFSTLKALRLFV